MTGLFVLYKQLGVTNPALKVNTKAQQDFELFYFYLSVLMLA
jgi:hypothetical protein